MRAYKINKEQSSLAAIRKRLGLTQQQLADKLNISRSAVMMAENGHRSLPTEALLEVARLEINLSGPGEVHAMPHPAESESLEKCRREFDRLVEEESNCRLKSRKLIAKLGVMKLQYQRSRTWLHLVEMSLEEHGAGEWLQRQQQQVIARLNTCSLPEQALITARISLLDAQAEMHRAMQTSLKKQLPGYFLKRE